MHVALLGKRWRLRFAPNLANRGDCDAPTLPNKEIRISSALDGEELLEVLVHEFTHAAYWHLDEEYVEKFAKDVARELTRLGFTRQVQA